MERHLLPLTYNEIKDKFKLEEILQYGSLPPVFTSTKKDKIDILSSYANSYLREEIQAEGIVRNLGGFSRFLDMAASQFGELTNYSSIGRECQLPTRTVQSYYEILEDTLIGFKLEPWRRSIRKRLSAHPKFYFFDCGIVNAINRQLTGKLDSILRGRLFEQLVILETYRTIHYLQSEARMFYWRTNHGAEIDLLIEKHGEIKAAIEIKPSSNISGSYLSGIRSFRDNYSKVPCYIVCNAQNNYELERVKIISLKDFLEQLPKLI